MKSLHQARVEGMMNALAKKGVSSQAIPQGPTLLTPEVAELRAKLILEEALETIEALGFKVWANGVVGMSQPQTHLKPNGKGFSMDEAVDGCCDTIVVCTGTLSSMGIHDETVLHEVDMNNLAKINNGTIREDGKLIKPPNHPKPNLAAAIQRQLDGQW